MDFLRLLPLLFLLGPAGALALAAQPITATARFDPQVAAAGEAVDYEITVRGTSERIEAGDVPQPPGLEIDTRPNIGTNVSIVNGQRSVSVQYRLRARASRPGTYTVPSWEVTVEGRTVRIPATQVRIVSLEEKYGGAFFAEVEAPEEPVYVGQAVPVTFTLYVRPEVDFQANNPSLQSEAFTLRGMDEQPARTRVQREGSVYEAFRWDLVAFPLKAGEHDLTFLTPMVFVVRAGNNRPFGFYHFSGSERRAIDLPSRPATLEVRNLPAESRPEGFSGAIGQFSAKSTLSAEETRAGEPVTLTLEVTGTGNFARMSDPPYPETAGVRAYEPDSSFQPRSEDDALNGTRIIEYILVPQEEGLGEVPAPAFSFFDPQAREFVTLPTGPLPLTVGPAPEGSLPAAEAPADTPPEERRRLLGPVLELGTPASAIAPPFFSTGFWAWQAVPLGLIVGLMGYGRWQKQRRADPTRATRHAHEKESAACEARARAAASSGEADTFYAAALDALQHRYVARRPSARKESVTATEITALLHERGAPAEALQAAEELFHAASARRYGGGAATPGDLAAEAARLRTILEALS